MDNNTILGEAPIGKLMRGYAIPCIISLLVGALYNIVDQIFIANASYLGSYGNAANTVVFPLTVVALAIAVMVGDGCCAFVSMALGREEPENAKRCVGNAVVLIVAASLVLTAAYLIFADGIIAMFGGTVNEETFRHSQEYFFYITLGIPFYMFGQAMNPIIRADGNPKFAMVSTLAGAVVNIILDPVLIFGLGPFPMLGISGAALATGIGQCVTLSVYLIIYCTHRFPVQLRLSCIKPDWRLDAKLYSIGVPAILNLALPSVLVSFLNSLLAAYSQGYVVILGIYYKLQTFLYLPAGGIVQGMRPLISYNYGAGEHGRVKKIYNLAMGMNAAIMAAGTIICLVGSPALIGMFTTNADTIAAGQVALRIISAGFLVSTLSVTASGSLEALGKGTQSLIISLCRYIIIMIPAAWILCRMFGPVGVWHAFWVTELLSALAAALVYKRTVKLNV